MNDAKLESLIAQCKNNDVDIKVDALSKLQAEFEAGIEIADPEPIINALKACLRTSNQHLTTATLSALPPFLPLIITRPGAQSQFAHAPQPSSASSSTSSVAGSSLIDVSTLRHVIIAFLPTGGVVDRLGEPREKAREKARETLVVLGGLAFRGGGASSSAKAKASGTETPLMMFERYLREGGLASKVWRVREQAILTLVHVRRTHHLFPIRSYLPQLVATLEDTDGNVRECARQSVVELFTGPGVTDAARADLKKEMTKKGVRKNIVDNVLARLVAGGSGGTASYPASEGSENGDIGTKKEYIPPSLALQGRKPTGGLATSTGPSGVPRTVSYGAKELSRPASRSAVVSPTPAPVPIASETGSDVQAITSARDMESEFEDMMKPFEGKETEHNWAAREKAIQRVRGMLKGDAHNRYTEAFLACLKEGFIKWSLKTLASLRTTVASNTCSLYSELTIALGAAMDPFCETLLTPLLRMASFTKKIVAQQSQAVVTTILTHTSAQPRVSLPLLSATLQEKTVQARAFVLAHIKTYLEVHGVRSKHAIESSGGAEILEKCMKRALADANVSVRETARICFWVFESVWHDRGLAVLETLDSLARKQLEKACPDPNAAAAIIPPTTPKNAKKTSVAAAIAASRAKAKAIATAPPTLRHQATSTSYAVRATSPTGLRHSVSPPTSPKSRNLSGSTMARTTSSPGAVPVLHTRSASSSSTSTPPDAIRRTTSSPLAGSPPHNSILRKAAQTALPASPPRSTTGLVHHSPVHSSPTARRTNVSRAPAAVPVLSRPSTIMSLMNGNTDESLLLASEVPIPEDSDSDHEDSVNLMSFSTPFEVYPPFPLPKSDSQARSFSPKSTDSRPNITNALSTPEHVQGEVVEDALRARAEQAESAAERLLELVDPDDGGSHHSTIPTSLLLGSDVNATPNVKIKHQSQFAPPVTPMNRNTAILKQAALFKNSPAYNGTAPSLLDVLKDRKDESSWWLKRMNLIDHGTPLKAIEPYDRTQELRGFITALEQGQVTIRVLQKVALLCIENPVADPSSPTSPFSTPASPSPFEARKIPPLHADIWTKDKNFERLFNALVTFLDPSRVSV
ncbi:hypothetical protein HWV62_32610 [Athelia sp. TMB]|nr:hypothetical protein HWV62_41170 [Athelia sp. TMB]KAF7981576.1 hypothetical protein HWV62_32610 [Athelia sp. TMB]